jgi:hypothetical protein
VEYRQLDHKYRQYLNLKEIEMWKLRKIEGKSFERIHSHLRTHSSHLFRFFTWVPLNFLYIENLFILIYNDYTWVNGKRATSCAANHFWMTKPILLKTTFIDLGETTLLCMILHYFIFFNSLNNSAIFLKKYSYPRAVPHTIEGVQVHPLGLNILYQ